MRCLPTAVEPVKLSLRTKGLAVNTAPMTCADPVTTFNVPAGKPARTASSQSANAVKGVADAGLTMTVHPAARAAATLRVTMAAGRFHGVIAAQTPMGSLRTTMRLSA